MLPWMLSPRNYKITPQIWVRAFIHFRRWPLLPGVCHHSTWRCGGGQHSSLTALTPASVFLCGVSMSASLFYKHSRSIRRHTCEWTYAVCVLRNTFVYLSGAYPYWERLTERRLTWNTDRWHLMTPREENNRTTSSDVKLISCFPLTFVISD